MSPGWFALSVVVLVGLLGYIFYTHGGAIQKVVLTKTNTTDIRSATFVDLIYGIVLFLFKEVSNLPMSTTWVFVGLLAGREIAIAWNEKHRGRPEVTRLVLSDLAKIFSGLAVSVAPGAAAADADVAGPAKGSPLTSPSSCRRRGGTGGTAAARTAASRSPAPSP